jgi:hypothetical protein
MQEQVMRGEVRNICKITVDSIRLILTPDKNSHAIKKRCETSNHRFRFGKPMLVRVKFNVKP